MFLSKNWLTRYVDIPETFDTFTELSLHTAEVEEAKDIGVLPHIVIGHVLELEQHPDADRLRVATVDTGTETRTIVCGAPNIAKGQRVPVALPGAVMPAGFEIKESKLRGVLSQGMICSKDELGLIEERQEGIWELPETAPIGERLDSWLNCADTVYEIENKSITNRPDLFGHYGLARELAVLTKGTLKSYLTQPTPPETDHLPALDISIEAPEACARYVGVVVENITPKPSPEWLVQALENVGIRSRNSIVDITNYVMMDLGQPMHAFDYDKIDGNTLSVGYSDKTEIAVETLDGEQRHVAQPVLLVKNGTKPIALAGIMGLADSAISDATSSILLEAALFDKSVIRKGEGLLNLRTDASIRFEKGLAFEHPLLAIYKALELLQEIHPEANIASQITDIRTTTPENVVIETSWEFLLKRIGDSKLDIPIAEGILTALGFTMETQGEKLLVTVPFWRASGDCSIPEDLVEELVRIYGFNTLSAQVPEMPLHANPDDPMRQFVARLKEELALQQHLTEVHNYSFYSHALHEEFLLKEGIHADPIRVLNPLSSEAEIMRTSLVPLLGKGAAKYARQYPESGIFEIEKIYWKENGKVYDDAAMHDFEDMRAGIFLYGNATGESLKDTWTQHPFFHLKLMVEQTLHRLGIQNWRFTPPTAEQLSIYPWAHPKQALALQVRGKCIGVIAGLHPKVLRNIDLEERSAAAAEWSVSALLPAQKTPILQSYSEFPSVHRDVSFVTDKHAAAGTFLTLAQGIDPLVSEVTMLDVYEGERLAGQKSLTLKISFSHPEKTLTDKEINSVMERLFSAAEKAGATVRS